MSMCLISMFFVRSMFFCPRCFDARPGFAINRLSLIGKELSKFVTRVSGLTIGKFMLITIWPCLILPVVKIFRFIPNRIFPDYDYPNPIAFYFYKLSFSLIFVYLSFNILFDLVNYLLFLVFNFVLEVILVIKMKRTIEEKQKNEPRIFQLLIYWEIEKYKIF